MNAPESVAVTAGSAEPDINILTTLGPPEDGETNLLGFTVFLSRDLSQRLAACGALVKTLPPVEQMKFQGLISRTVDCNRPTANVVSVMARELGAELAFACVEALQQAQQTTGGTANAG